MAAPVVPRQPEEDADVGEFVVTHHPTTDGDDVPLGQLLIVRDVVAPGGYLVAKVTRVEGETIHVQFYSAEGLKWRPAVGSDSTGEVEKAGILARGDVLSKKDTIKKGVLTEVTRQLAAEETDRLLDD